MKFQNRNFLHRNRKNSCNRSEKQSFFFCQIQGFGIWYRDDESSNFFSLNLSSNLAHCLSRIMLLYLELFQFTFVQELEWLTLRIKILPGLEWCVTAFARLAVRESAYFRIGLYCRKHHMTNCNLFICGYHIDQKKSRRFLEKW